MCKSSICFYCQWLRTSACHKPSAEISTENSDFPVSYSFDYWEVIQLLVVHCIACDTTASSTFQFHDWRLRRTKYPPQIRRWRYQLPCFEGKLHVFEIICTILCSSPVNVSNHLNPSFNFFKDDFQDLDVHIFLKTYGLNQWASCSSSWETFFKLSFEL